MGKSVVHVANIPLDSKLGMGRIAVHWRSALERSGWNFTHFGKEEIGEVWHYSLFPPQALRAVSRAGLKPNVLLLHEGCAWAFARRREPKIVFSHGLERRLVKCMDEHEPGSRLKARLFQSGYMRLNRMGLRCADLVLVSSHEDRNILLKDDYISPDKVVVFRNGCESYPATTSVKGKEPFTILFNGSWIPRKGTEVLIKAASEVFEHGLRVNWCLVGTGKSSEEVLTDWPYFLHSSVEVVPSFTPGEEGSLLEAADLFVLPSYFEGQPLSLVQAMAAGKCCIASDCCGQRDLVSNGTDGLLFVAGDWQALASQIIFAHDNIALRNLLQSAARRKMENSTWDMVSSEVAALITRFSDR